MAFPLRVLTISLLLLTAACGTTQQPVPAKTDFFGDSLASEYQGFADSEAELGREAASEHFSRKAADARKNGDVLPEDPASWNLQDSDEVDDLLGARRRLMHLRGEFLERVSGQDLARAQVLYDCWLLQTGGHHKELAAECRSGFLGEIRQLEIVQKGRDEKKALTLPASYTIYFPSGGTRLDRDGEYVIGQVKTLIARFPDYSIDVSGHSDSVGDDAENLQLSEKRAKRVADALVAAGADPARIETAWLGKDDPQEPTLDGTARRENRRVEVDVMQARHAPQEASASGE